MTNPYNLGTDLSESLVQSQIKFQNDLVKIWVSTVQANPFTTWMKLVANDIFSESLNLFNPLNRNYSIK